MLRIFPQMEVNNCKKVRISLYRTNVLNYCNRLLIISHLNFHKIWSIISYRRFFRFCATFGVFFLNIRESLNKVRVNLHRTNFFHHCNKNLVCLSSKFDRLKQFHYVRIKKKHTNLLQCFEFFFKFEIGFKKSKTQFIRSWCLS